jgi:predicted NUDIX family NTP pyrophosphohydrolase
MNKSAGILLFRRNKKNIEFFLVHPGGPFWAKKDAGAWSIPKGEYNDDEDALVAAKREFEEETGQSIDGDFIELKPLKQKGGKIVQAYAVEGDIDADNIRSNTFEMEWPPKSGRRKSFPEVDRAEWFDADTAKEKINEKQAELIEEVMMRIGSSDGDV